ncbi:hypothetical protein GCM10010267_69040 [Streptomyces griseorubens]|uniref:serine/threonine-protein kinase n=1 Tax=Streptomyces griseorubens TaxID=66897 RepID=UPI0017810163|nr:hypothetical protein GCM10010267_69040 [Streptomyces griseorubens]
MDGLQSDLVDGRFRRIRVIGSGGMGRVWLCRDERLGRQVALKEISHRFGSDEAQRERELKRFEREAMAAAALKHDGIVTVHDTLPHLDPPMIVMEYIDGPSLRGLLDNQKRVPVDRVVEIGVAVLSALQVAHTHGVVHRDLKPDNILVSRERVVLTDFGIALIDNASPMTTDRVPPGTPNYMAPEQFDGGRGTSASDLWSLAITLYEAAEGRHPFAGENHQTRVNAIRFGDPLPARHAINLMPFFNSLLVKEANQRPDARQARELLTTSAGQGRNLYRPASLSDKSESVPFDKMPTQSRHSSPPSPPSPPLNPRQPTPPATLVEPEQSRIGIPSISAGLSESSASPLKKAREAPKGFGKFWFAVPTERQLMPENLAPYPICILQPGVWFQAMELRKFPNGKALVVETPGGDRGLLWHIEDIQQRVDEGEAPPFLQVPELQPSRAQPAPPFWFSVPFPRPIYAEDGRPYVAAQLTPGQWYLAVAFMGEALLVQNSNGVRGILRDTWNLQFG